MILGGKIYNIIKIIINTQAKSGRITASAEHTKYQIYTIIYNTFLGNKTNVSCSSVLLKEWIVHVFMKKIRTYDAYKNKVKFTMDLKINNYKMIIQVVDT